MATVSEKPSSVSNFNCTTNTSTRTVIASCEISHPPSKLLKILHNMDTYIKFNPALESYKILSDDPSGTGVCTAEIYDKYQVILGYSGHTKTLTTLERRKNGLWLKSDVNPGSLASLVMTHEWVVEELEGSKGEESKVTRTMVVLKNPPFTTNFVLKMTADPMEGIMEHLGKLADELEG